MSSARGHEPLMDRVQAAFRPEPESVPAARHFVADWLRGLGCDADAAEVVVTEFAANAVKYARTDFVVEVSREDDRAWLEVRDGSPELPPTVGPESERWGLHLVDGFVTEWWSRRGPDGGKAVFARFPC